MPLWLGMCAAGAVATILAFATLDAQFLMGTGGLWVQPSNDSAGYVVAWRVLPPDSVAVSAACDSAHGLP